MTHIIYNDLFECGFIFSLLIIKLQQDYGLQYFF